MTFTGAISLRPLIVKISIDLVNLHHLSPMLPIYVFPLYISNFLHLIMKITATKISTSLCLPISVCFGTNKLMEFDASDGMVQVGTFGKTNKVG
jgi:hypothetical protein